MPLDKKIVFAAINLNSKIPKRIGVKWIEYDEKDVKLTFRNANLAQTFTTDGRKETVITAPKLPNPDADKAEEIAYSYTIQSVPPKSTGTAGKAAQEQEEPPQQQETRTIRLLPGESQGIQLPAGSYTITETIQGPVEQIGFTMKVAGHPFGTTEANQKFEVQIGGRRTLTISKPAALLPGQAEDNRTYSFWVFGELVELRAGESKTVTLPKEGSYTITPHNDSLDTYQLNYTDSGAIYGTASGSTGSVTFTNSFSQGEYAYRYIHEYYVKKADGSYQHEGSSAITTVRGRSKGEIYQAGNIRKDTSHNGVEYIHFDESYGWVTPLSPESSVNVKEDTEARSAQNAPPFSSEYQGILSEGTGTANTDTGTRQIAYAPVADWTESRVTTDARELIILRYFREENPKGTYKVIHEYYLRDKTGDHWEGATSIEDREGELDIPYTEKAVDKKTRFQPRDQQLYTYVWDKQAQYGVAEPGPGLDAYTGQQQIYQINSSWKWVVGAAEGDQIIILRYYREPVRQGKYQIVHEYYFREPLDNQDTEENTPSEEDTKPSSQPEAPEETAEPGENTEQPGSGENTDQPGTGENTDQPGTGENPEQPGTGENPEQPDINEDDAGQEAKPSDEQPVPISEGDSTPSGTLGSDSQYSYSFEGARQIETRTAPLGTTHQGTEADRKTDWSPENHTPYTYSPYDVVYGVADGNGGYRYLSDKQWASSTETGNEIIILRYFREEQPKGGYKIIHEYYLRDHTGVHWEGTTGIESQVSELGNTYTGDDVEQKPNFQPEGEMPYTYTWEQTLYGKMEPGAEDAAYNGPDGLYQINSAWTAVQATRAGDQIIILRYYRQKPEGKYNIIHEYYCLDRDGRHHWEGATDVENLSGYLGDTYTGEAVEKKPEFQPPEVEGPYTYTWDKSPLYGVTDSGPGLDQYTGRQKIYAIDSARTAAQVTRDGNQIIILRYYRQPPADPPDNPPNTPDNPPDTPDDPPKLTELPDPNDPDSPEEITIWEDGVPKTYIKIWQPEEEEWVYIPAEDVPLGQTPKTGDPNSTGLWILLALCSLTGLWMLALRPKAGKSAPLPAHNFQGDCKDTAKTPYGFL